MLWFIDTYVNSTPQRITSNWLVCLEKIIFWSGTERVQNVLKHVFGVGKTARDWVELGIGNRALAIYTHLRSVFSPKTKPNHIVDVQYIDSAKRARVAVFSEFLDFSNQCVWCVFRDNLQQRIMRVYCCISREQVREFGWCVCVFFGHCVLDSCGMDMRMHSVNVVREMLLEMRTRSVHTRYGITSYEQSI